MLRYMTDRARPSLVALYDIRPGNGAGQFLQPRSRTGLMEPRMIEVLATTGAIRCAKLQSNRHQRQTKTKLLEATCPSCRLIKSWKGKKYHSVDLLTSSMPGNFPTLTFTTKGSWLYWRGEGCQTSRQPSDTSTRTIV